MGGFISRPFRHIAVFGVLEILALAELIFPRNVTGMSKGFTLAAKFHAEMIRCHVVSAPGRAHCFCPQGETYKCALL